MEFIISHLSIIVIPLLCIYLLHKILSCGIFTLIGNVFVGGILYYLIDSFHIVKMNWNLIDLAIVAFFGTPGTICLALWQAFF